MIKDIKIITKWHSHMLAWIGKPHQADNGLKKALNYYNLKKYEDWDREGFIIQPIYNSNEE